MLASAIKEIHSLSALVLDGIPLKGSQLLRSKQIFSVAFQEKMVSQSTHPDWLS